jgi:hypothetical protein
VAAAIYGVALSANGSLSGPAGEQVLYSVTISNTGNVSDSFDLTATGCGWTTALSSPVVTLAAGDSRAMGVTVSIPPAATALARDRVTIRATSQHDGSKHAAAVLTTVSTGQPAKTYRAYLSIVLLDAPQ